MLDAYQPPESEIGDEDVLASSEHRLVVVAKYETEIQAQIYVSYLEEYGITAVLQGANTNTTLSVIGVALGVGLAVRKRDAQQATRLLTLSHETVAAQGSAVAWVCGSCGETVDGDFDICWSCSSDRSPDAVISTRENTHLDGAAEEQVEMGSSESDGLPAFNSQLEANLNPLPSQAFEREDDANERGDDAKSYANSVDEAMKTADDLLHRALISAVIGLLIVPLIFHVYSLYLLFSIHQKLDTPRVRHFMLTLGLVVLGVGTWIVILGNVVPSFFESLLT